MLEFIPVLIAQQLSSDGLPPADRDFKGERGGGLVTFAIEERVVPVAVIRKGY